jgi:putative copper export protein
MPDWGVVARIVHVLAVVVWIGGVWLVTTVLLPAMRRHPPERWIAEFEQIEGRFAPQARIAVILVLLSGLAMLWRYDLWRRFALGGFWWMHLMVGVWALFALVLFIGEPLVLRRIIHRRGRTAPQATLRLMVWLHRLLLILALAAIVGAIGGARGLF